MQLLLLHKASSTLSTCPLQEAITALVSDQNTQFDGLAAEFNATNENVQVQRYGLHDLFTDVTNPSAPEWGSSFTNTQDACRDGNLDDVQVSGFTIPLCDNPENYLWWDVVSMWPALHFNQNLQAPFQALSPLVPMKASDEREGTTKGML